MFKSNGTKQRGTIHFEWTPLEVVKKWSKAKQAEYWAYWENVKKEKIKREEEEKECEARKASRQLRHWLGMAALEGRVKPVKEVSGNGAASTGKTWGPVKQYPVVRLAEILVEKKEQTGNGAAREETEMATNVVAPVVVEHASVQVAPVNAAVKAVVNAGVIGLVAMLTAQGIEFGEGAVAAISAVVEANIKRDEPVVVETVVVEPVVVEPVVAAPVVTETVDKNAVANAAATRIQALWRGYMQRKKPVDAPVVVEPVVVAPKERHWADYSDSEDEEDEKSVAAPDVVESPEKIFRKTCEEKLKGTFGNMWIENDPKYPTVSRAKEVYTKIARMLEVQVRKLFERAEANTYHKIPRGEWEKMGLTPENLKATCQAVCAADGVEGRIEAFLAKAVEYGWANTSVKFTYNKGKEVKESPAFYAICVLYNAGKVKPKTPKQGFTPVNKANTANKVSDKTEKRGFVPKEKKVEKKMSTEAAAAAGTTTNSASAPVAQPVNDVLARTLRGKWFAVKAGDQNKKMSAEQKAFEDALDELVRVATGRSLVEVCSEYCREGGSVEIKGAVNAFIIAKVNVVETKSPYTNALIGSAMDEPENADAVLVASEEDLVSILNGVKEAMKKAMEQASA